jgi:SPP1 family phage portal protein
VAYRYNAKEIPLITRVKSLQDAINDLLSDLMNSAQEDARNTVLILVNYQGQDLGEFRRNLATYGAVKVSNEYGVQGDVRTLRIETDPDNAKTILELLKKALVENARGFDAKDDRMSGNPNQMNIQSMYSDIDLDANGAEAEFQSSMEEVIWYVDQNLAHSGHGDFSGEHPEIVFNRDILINETDAIAGCRQSVGILSSETIISQHPWVNNVEQELARIKDEKAQEAQEAEQYALAFGAKPPGDASPLTEVDE